MEADLLDASEEPSANAGIKQAGCHQNYFVFPEGSVDRPSRPGGIPPHWRGDAQGTLVLTRERQKEDMTVPAGIPGGANQAAWDSLLSMLPLQKSTLSGKERRWRSPWKGKSREASKAEEMERL
ncbi:hypothetical protein PsorP6_000689 [Peronosclerospora sorghi]|uniref:Uncharacterized protein n=1 Tax=Peronosclerospora sorghi TaxID=230839 RepID=A0ACC0WWS9_9STRA|nr:hypothetical protein PsorP6_000689 [Peronosclerospora sorghi]